MAEKRIGSLAEQLPHPGETLVELLETYGMSQLELSERIGFTTKHINEVCKGKKPITPDMSMRFLQYLIYLVPSGIICKLIMIANITN